MKSIPLVALLAYTPAVADQIDDYIKSEIERTHVPAASVAVVQDGKIVKAAGYGFSNLETQTKATTDTVYEIGSCTKQFTATLVMMFVEEGKIELDKPILSYLEQLPSKWEKVTVRHLLNHTSGIPNYTQFAPFALFAKTDHKPDDVIAMVKDKPLGFQPGSAFAYCNTGYYILGMLLEKVSGDSYWNVLQERILKPLGMTHTRNSDPWTVIPNRATGYAWASQKFVQYAPITPTAGYSAGSIVSTLGDLAKWEIALTEGRLLKNSSWQEAWKPATLSSGAKSQYGFGWAIGKMSDSNILEHSGGTAAFTSHILRIPDKKLCVIVLTNSNSAPVTDFAARIAEIYEPSLKAKPVKAILDEKKVGDRLKEVLTAIINKSAKKEWFNESMQQAMWPTVIFQAAEDLKSLGELKSLVPFDKKMTGKRESWQFEATFSNRVVTIVFDLDEDGRIAGLGLKRR